MKLISQWLIGLSNWLTDNFLAGISDLNKSMSYVKYATWLAMIDL